MVNAKGVMEERQRSDYRGETEERQKRDTDWRDRGWRHRSK
jgi:hypothetical protein